MEMTFVGYLLDALIELHELTTVWDCLDQIELHILECCLDACRHEYYVDQYEIKISKLL